MSKEHNSNDDKVLEAARQLNVVVVSLDRIGSAYAGASIDERSKALDAFANEWQLFKRLSRARTLLYDVLAANAESDAVLEEIDARMGDLPYWTRD